MMSGAAPDAGRKKLLRMLARLQREAREHDRRQRLLQLDVESEGYLVLDRDAACACGWRGAKLLQPLHDDECPLRIDRLLGGCLEDGACPHCGWRCSSGEYNAHVANCARLRAQVQQLLW